MSPLCTPLRPISGNRPKGSEISPYMRGQVLERASEGTKLAAITVMAELEQ
jgi:hypothetical protein